MKNKSLAFRLILGSSAIVHVAVITATMVVLRDPSAEPASAIVWGLAGGAVFFALVMAIIGRKARFYAVDYVELSARPADYGKELAEFGAAPLASLILYLIISLVYLGTIAFAGPAAGIQSADRWPVLSLLLAVSMLAAAFLYVLSDKLTLTTLLGRGLLLYPSSLRENRQQRKNFIIPIFMTLMALLFAFSTAFLLAAKAPPEVRASENFGWYMPPLFGMSAVFLAVIVSLMLVWNSSTGLLFRSVLEQLERLSSADKDLSGRISITSVDEIASISGMINTFTDSLASSMRDIGAIYGDLSTIQEQLFDGIRASSSSAGDIASGIDRVLGMIEREDEAIRGGLESARQLSSHAAGLAGAAHDQSSSVSGSVERVETAMKAVSRLGSESAGVSKRTAELVSSFRAGESDIKTAIEVVGAVSSRSADLVEINKLISAVAAKTNLLAMNASIEAAHAGEFGRGFSVVADEIRSLAESTAVHTRRSKESLNEILGLIGKALESAESIGRTFADIRKSVEELNGVATAISDSMGEQGHRNAEILALLGDTEKLARGVSETAGAVDGIAAAMAARLGEAAEDSRGATDLSRQMRERNEELRNAVAEVDGLAAKAADLNARVATLIDAFRT